MSYSDWFKNKSIWGKSGHAQDHKAMNTPTYANDTGGNATGLVGIMCATFASIPALTKPSFVYVQTDETNGAQSTVYFYNGTSLQWLPTVGV